MQLTVGRPLRCVISDMQGYVRSGSGGSLAPLETSSIPPDTAAIAGSAGIVDLRR
jgi:hypothetical protein